MACTLTCAVPLPLPTRGARNPGLGGQRGEGFPELSRGPFVGAMGFQSSTPNPENRRCSQMRK